MLRSDEDFFLSYNPSPPDPQTHKNPAKYPPNKVRVSLQTIEAQDFRTVSTLKMSAKQPISKVSSFYDLSGGANQATRDNIGGGGTNGKRKS